MKILIVSEEEWNDYVYGNNILTNWFSGFDAKFAHIYASPGKPINGICRKYFQITDKQMVCSMFSARRAGGEISMPVDLEDIERAKKNVQREGVYLIFKRLSLLFGPTVLFIKDLIWCLGRYDLDRIHKFVDDFSPDYVFCPRYVSPKLMRLEKIVSQCTKAPFVAYTGDNEIMIDVHSFSPVFVLRKLYINWLFNKHVFLYSNYLMHSIELAHIYQEKYNLDTTVIFKSGEIKEHIKKEPPLGTIKMVYAGHLYCNRWRTLLRVAHAMSVINQEKPLIRLDVYTQDDVSYAMKKRFSRFSGLELHGYVSPNQLTNIYNASDIALHVESLDESMSHVTKFSFSTKIIDLLSSSCAVMAICPSNNCGFKYLKLNNSAICIDHYEQILPALRKILLNPNIISQYSMRAYICCLHNHSINRVTASLTKVFSFN